MTKFEELMEQETITTDNVMDFILESNVQQSVRGVIYLLTPTKQTEKAVLFEAETDYGTVTFWCPKSCVITDRELAEQNEKLANSMEQGLEYNLQLLAFAKENGVKGVRKGLRTETLIRKIEESGLTAPSKSTETVETTETTETVENTSDVMIEHLLKEDGSESSIKLSYIIVNGEKHYLLDMLTNSWKSQKGMKEFSEPLEIDGLGICLEYKNKIGRRKEHFVFSDGFKIKKIYLNKKGALSND